MSINLNFLDDVINCSFLKDHPKPEIQRGRQRFNQRDDDRNNAMQRIQKNLHQEFVVQAPRRLEMASVINFIDQPEEQKTAEPNTDLQDAVQEIKSILLNEVQKEMSVVNINKNIIKFLKSVINLLEAYIGLEQDLDNDIKNISPKKRQEYLKFFQNIQLVNNLVSIKKYKKLEDLDPVLLNQLIYCEKALTRIRNFNIERLTYCCTISQIDSKNDKTLKHSDLLHDTKHVRKRHHSDSNMIKMLIQQQNIILQPLPRRIEVIRAAIRR